MPHFHLRCMHFWSVLDNARARARLVPRNTMGVCHTAGTKMEPCGCVKSSPEGAWRSEIIRGRLLRGRNSLEPINLVAD
jgi:hypothetical protein